MKLSFISPFFIILLFFLSGCSSGGDTPPDPTPKAPETYSQKIILEQFTGAWNGNAPDGLFIGDKLKTKYGANFFQVLIHNSDQMAKARGNSIAGFFNQGGIPTGMINRMTGSAENRSIWETRGDLVKAIKALCGLSIDAKEHSGNNYKIDVSLGIGKAALPKGNYFLTVYAVAKTVSGTGSGWDQMNYYDDPVQFPGHPYNNKGNPIVGFEHRQALIDVLTPVPAGLPLDPADLKGRLISKYSYNLDITGLDSANVEIVSLISEFTDDPLLPGIESSLVLNAQKTALGSKTPWD